MTDYLPRHATIEQACAWLNERTGKDWSLARLLEYRLMPWVWLEHAPGYPAIFGDRLEGYLAPMVFAGDTHRLEVDGTHALITMTRTHDGKLMRLNPGIHAPLSELRFKREDLEATAAYLEATAASDAPEKEASASDAPEKEAAAPVTGNWQAAARTIADECFDADTRNKCRDSMAGYARRVMDLMQEREIHGPRGRITNPNTIAREALQGDQWWKHKKK